RLMALPICLDAGYLTGFLPFSKGASTLTFATISVTAVEYGHKRSSTPFGSRNRGP
ncbi:TPA_asm: hypothetical protein, partial [ssRNA phage Zoerhiza.1_38]